MLYIFVEQLSYASEQHQLVNNTSTRNLEEKISLTLVVTLDFN